MEMEITTVGVLIATICVLCGFILGFATGGLLTLWMVQRIAVRVAAAGEDVIDVDLPGGGFV